MAASLPPRHLERHSVGFESVFQHSLSEAMAAGRWQDLVAGIGVDVADAVRQTLAGLTELSRSQRIGRHEARWLHTRLQPLYQAGVTAQRLSRLADHRSLDALEAVQLDDVVADAIVHHQRHSHTHRIAAELSSLQVLAQPEALSGAVDSLMTWSLRLGRLVSLRMVKSRTQARGELWLKVEHLDAQAHEERFLNSVDWYVLWQLARLKGVKVRRKVEPQRIRVVIQFNRVMQRNSAPTLLEVPEIQDETPAFDPDVTAVWAVMPLHGLCREVINALQPQIRNVQAVGDLRSLVESHTVPDCVVSVAEIVDTEDFRSWRRRAQERRGRNIAVVAVTDRPNVFDIGGFGPKAVARVSAGSIGGKLLSAVVFELSHLAGDDPALQELC
jgi:hypothetical protein